MFATAQKRFYVPRVVARASNIRSGQTVVDILAGYQGTMTFEAAALAGSQGIVYAVDLRKTALQALKGRCELGHAGNIEAVHGHVERVGGVPLADQIADAVLLVDALSLLENRLEVVREVVRLLKSGGILTVVDWHPFGDARHGPDAARRLSEQEARSLCLVNALQYEGTFDTGDYHYGFTCRRI
ncbi:TPA: hypothetical protein DEB00_03055 [Candidatus Uhrbacteria bacterium]|nr:hypothetical protein [Candidatus Uhrbacteria bacterium]